MTFRQQLRAWLSRHRLTARQAAEKFGCSRRTVEGWCGGKRPDPFARRIAEKIMEEKCPDTQQK